jgi:hypothetical protein
VDADALLCVNSQALFLQSQSTFGTVCDLCVAECALPVRKCGLHAHSVLGTNHPVLGGFCCS